ATDKSMGREIGPFLADSLKDLRTQDIEPHDIARWYVPAADATGLTARLYPPLVAASVSRFRHRPGRMAVSRLGGGFSHCLLRRSISRAPHLAWTKIVIALGPTKAVMAFVAVSPVDPPDG